MHQQFFGFRLALGFGLTLSTVMPAISFTAANPAFAQSAAPRSIETPDSSSANSGPIPIESPAGASGNSVITGTRFSCQVQGGQYTVMYQPKGQPNQYFPWAVPAAMGGGWSPERRCYEISRRLEAYRPDGLVEMKTSSENGYNIVCATSENNPACRIVFTVPNGQDPINTRDRVFANLATADSGQQTLPVNTFVEGQQGISSLDVLGILGITPRQSGSRNSASNYPPNYPSDSNYPSNYPSSYPTSYMGDDGIYLKPFLDPADGGTGEALFRGGDRANYRGLYLNPNDFR